MLRRILIGLLQVEVGELLGARGPQRYPRARHEVQIVK